MLTALATPKRLLLAAWLLFVIYAYPGYMTYDSVYQLVQARHLEPISDWAPPVMALIWRLTDHVIAGPFPMLVIQSATFLVGTYVLLQRVMKPRAAAITASCVLLFPPILAPMSVIWKDSQMAGFLVAGAAALLSDRRGWRIAGFALLSLATAMRYNALAATLPIVVLLAFREVTPITKRVALASAAWLGITVAAFAANKIATEREAHIFQSSLALSDIAGTLRWAKHLDDHQILVDYFDLPWAHTDKLRARAHNVYSPYNTWLELTNPGPKQLFTTPTTDADFAAITSAWLDLVRRQPLAYLHSRFDVFRGVLAGGASGESAVWEGFTDAPWSESVLFHRARHSELQQASLDVAEKLGSTWLFRPWIYFVLGLVFLVLARSHALTFAIIASGVVNELSLFVLTPATDFRYSHWMIVCTVVGGAMLFVLRRREP